MLSRAPCRPARSQLQHKERGAIWVCRLQAFTCLSGSFATFLPLPFCTWNYLFRTHTPPSPPMLSLLSLWLLAAPPSTSAQPSSCDPLSPSLCMLPFPNNYWLDGAYNGGRTGKLLLSQVSILGLGATAPPPFCLLPCRVRGAIFARARSSCLCVNLCVYLSMFVCVCMYVCKCARIRACLCVCVLLHASLFTNSHRSRLHIYMSCTHVAISCPSAAVCLVTLITVYISYCTLCVYRL